MPTTWKSTNSEYLVDSNVLIYLVHVHSEFHLEAKLALERLESEGARLVFTAQNILEFWSVCTRPVGSGGLGYSVAMSEMQVRTLQARFQLAPDPPLLHEFWLKTVIDHRVLGRQVHDARIAACVSLLGMDRIITKNVRDFRRYSFLEAFDPADVLAGKN
jgi:predicted nucleic acid-binding protein